MILRFFSAKHEWLHLSSWHFLSSSVSAAEHISIISATCILCYIKCFHHGYHLVLSSSPRYYFCFRFFIMDLLLHSPSHPPLYSSSSSSFATVILSFVMLQHNIVIWVTGGLIRLGLFRHYCDSLSIDGAEDGWCFSHVVSALNSFSSFIHSGAVFGHDHAH